MLFYLKFALFQFLEPFSDFWSGLFGFFTFPFYVWVIGKLWSTYNAGHSSLTYPQVLIYAGTTELFFLTFLRVSFFSKASRDFSLGLATPRSWILQQFFGIFGKCLGSRLILLLFWVPSLLLVGVDAAALRVGFERLIPFLVPLSIVQALYSLGFAIAQVRFEQTSFFVLPISKFFLVLGGVFGPLCDFGEQWKRILLLLWPSDLFFQPAYFVATGSFYRLTPLEWILRILFQLFLLTALTQVAFSKAKRYHQAWGG